MSISIAEEIKTNRQTVHGVAKASFVYDGSKTKLDHLYYHDPLKILFPKVYGNEPPLAVMVTTGGGYFGGDQYHCQISAAENAVVTVTSQAAEKVYKSLGTDCVVNVHLQAAKQAQLEWLPQETIVFNHARFRRMTRVDIAESAQALVGEILVLGRTASGETFTHGLLREAWEVRQNNRLVWVDALQLDETTIHSLHHPAGWNGNHALATVLYIADNAKDILEDARLYQQTNSEAFSSATVVNGVLVMRWLSKSSMELRQAFGAFWSQFRNRTMGRSTTLPRVWSC